MSDNLFTPLTPKEAFLVGKLEAYAERLVMFLDREAKLANDKYEYHENIRWKNQSNEVEKTIQEVRALRDRNDYAPVTCKCCGK
jgi:hypothetical protein